MKIGPHRTWLNEENENNVIIYPASADAVLTVLGGGEDDEDGRSQFVWVRLGNGDLILGVFPQGDTYFATEHRHADMVSRGGDYPDGI